jgi:hypothetical protein
VLQVPAWPRPEASAIAVLIGEKMSHYEIYVTCTECSGEHPMHIRINLDDGPLDKQSVSHTYTGKTQPPQLKAVEGHKVLCFKTGRTFIQSNLDDVFLVPIDMTSKKVFSSV